MTPGLRIDQTREFHVGRWLFLLAFAALLAAAGWYGYNWYTKGELPPVPLPASAMADTSVDETPISRATLDSYKVPATHPRYISIPSLNIDKSRVMSVGLTKNNLLDTPKNIADTAWFNKSSTPGMGYGAVVIDGHNGGVTKDGVFAKLANLKKNDSIKVERGDGKKFEYLVVENTTMTLDETNKIGMKKMIVSADPTKEGLNLMTCAGNWVPRDKVFDKRVMIRAVLEK
jgi:LPXTG-site transpeptidase (sortase) family protein